MPENKEVDKVCETVRCPHCGWEYHPSEIFCPESEAGRPSRIVRDGLGKIIYVEYQEGREPSHREEFVCERCEKPFVAKVEVLYKAEKQEEELDFSEEESVLF